MQQRMSLFGSWAMAWRQIASKAIDSQQAADHAENDAREACTPGSHEQHAKGVLPEPLANLGWVPLYEVPA